MVKYDTRAGIKINVDLLKDTAFSGLSSVYMHF